MRNRAWSAPALAALALAMAASATVAATPPTSSVISSLDLAKPFATRSDWRFTATQGPPVEGVMGDPAPGHIQLCLRAGAAGPCDPALRGALRTSQDGDIFADAHYLNAVNILRPRGAAGPPLLWVQAASLYSGDGDQVAATQVLAYDQAKDSFTRIYENVTGHNNNQDVRFIEAGALRGDIVSVEPTDKGPYAFWVTVNAFAPGAAYRQVLRYRSATHYGDGNPLAVIDSEMANIEQHLGLWKPGAPLPLPAGPCPNPRLVGAELWCK
jgi:hypothetical protein